MELFNEMATFARVVEYGGFSPAARELGLEPSSVSRSVARLEKALGARLLHRSSRSIALTEVGEKIYQECRRLIEAAQQAQALAGRYHAVPAGVLRVSAPVVLGQLWLAPRLAGFLSRHPEVSLRVTLVDRPVDLIEDGVDVALRIAHELPPGLAARPLFAAPYVLVAAPAYLADHGTPGHPDSLAEHRCLHLGYGAFGPSWPLRRGDEHVVVSIPDRYSINNSAALATMIEGGAGIGLVPAFTAATGLAAGRLVRVLPDWTLEGTYDRTVHLVYPAGPHVATKVRAFVDYLAPTADSADRPGPAASR